MQIDTQENWYNSYNWFFFESIAITNLKIKKLLKIQFFLPELKQWDFIMFVLPSPINILELWKTKFSGVDEMPSSSMV